MRGSYPVTVIRDKVILKFISVGCLVGALALACLQREKAKGTTLMVPLYWLLGSFLAQLIVELLGFSHVGVGRAIRYGVVLLTCCPVMAVLGAKRPQDRGWQLIVVSLWAVQLLPAAQFIAFSSGEFQPDFAWRAFAIVLVIVGLANWIFTRFGASCLAYTFAQVLLLFWPGEVQAAIAHAILLLGVAMVWLEFPRVDKQKRQSEGVHWWFDFRDAFGAAWGLRVAERLNAAARANGWSSTIRWRGRQPADFDKPTSSTELEHRKSSDSTVERDSNETMNRCIRMLLRRFVSKEWIAERQPDLLDSRA